MGHRSVEGEVLVISRKKSGSVRAFLLVLLATGFAAGATFSSAGEVTVHRDQWGVPHIFGDSEEAACFGMGYAQAEDRLVELCKQYRRATGRMSEVFGPQFIRDDIRQRLWQHEDMAKSKYQELDPKVRGIIEAYQAGIRQYMTDHPDEVPEWSLPLEPWMCVALSRYIIWGWPEGDAGEDMQRAGVEPDPVGYRGSNEWLVAPSRTKYNAPIALIDPHLSWYDQFRFYESRIYGGELEFSGMGIVGLPLASLGHSRFCSIAMTTGGPDAADCYVEEINPENPRQYRYDGKWRDMTVRPIVIRVKDGDKVVEKPFDVEYTHHGPIAARKVGKAYVLKLPYFDQVKLLEQGFKMATAKNLAEMKSALSMLQLMEQNIMIGTVDGDIFYVRNGRVPVRPAGQDWTRPVPGNTSKTEWLGIHPFEELIQIHNPPQGYMQNCNVSPQFLMKNCPITADKHKERPYLFNGYYDLTRRYDNPLHQRAAMCLELLDRTKEMDVDQAIAIAMSPDVWGVDAWQKLLGNAWSGASGERKQNENLARMVDLILKWNRRCDPDSTGAIAYRYWKDEMNDQVKLADKAGFPPPKSVQDEELLVALEKGTEKILKDFGRVNVAYGDVYRVGRRGMDRDWPVGGGSVQGLATPRAISFSEKEGSKEQLGRGGQTSTQIVLLTKPPQSWTVLPLGQSDRPESKHLDDQAEKLFSKGAMKPTYFLNKALDKHVKSSRSFPSRQSLDGPRIARRPSHDRIEGRR
ncbi:MAG: penicillin acylase family protein [Planctomycetota bacterium]